MAHQSHSANVASIKPMAEPPRFAMARGTVRHVGEAVAAIIAESADQARDAAELVQVDYEPLPSVIDAKGALRDNAPLLHECAPGNDSTNSTSTPWIAPSGCFIAGPCVAQYSFGNVTVQTIRVGVSYAFR